MIDINKNLSAKNEILNENIVRLKNEEFLIQDFHPNKGYITKDSEILQLINDNGKEFLCTAKELSFSIFNSLSGTNTFTNIRIVEEVSKIRVFLSLEEFI